VRLHAHGPLLDHSGLERGDFVVAAHALLEDLQTRDLRGGLALIYLGSV
jgi:hypothetical protein